MLRPVLPHSTLHTPTRRLTALAALLLILLSPVLPLSLKAFQLATTLNSNTIQASLDALPLSFVPNVNQDDQSVRFQVRSLGGTLFFATDEVVLALPTHADRNAAKDAAPTVVRLRFDGANPAPVLSGEAPLPGTANYFVGNDPDKWRTDVPTYGGVVYRALYDGIDLRYDGNEGQLKGTYLLAPGADPQVIRWRYTGVSDVRADTATGNLLISLAGAAGRTLTESAPVAWQDIGGRRVPVQANYSLRQDGSVGFALGTYDHTQPLTIDPTLTYSTYLGGSLTDEPFGIAVDSNGNAYVTGRTYSTDFPTKNALYGTHGPGCCDAFVTKLSANGSTLVYSTYLGNTGGSDGYAIAVDSAGNAYITGQAADNNFPTKNAFQPTYHGGDGDAFVTKLNAAGNALVYSTYLGGSGSCIDVCFGERGTGIVVDSAGSAYVVGTTSSDDFPTKNPLHANRGGFEDAFVARLSTKGGALVYSTYLGGGGDDFGSGIAVDSAGAAYIVGTTGSTSFPTKNALYPTMNGSQDAFVAKLSALGTTLRYSTYLGGTGQDTGRAIAVDGAGNAYVTGYGTGGLPILNPVRADTSGVFITKLNTSGSALGYSSLLRGGDGYGIAVDGAGAAYVTGEAWANFPIKNALDSTINGTHDAFAMKLSPQGDAIRYSTFLGGDETDSPPFDVERGRDVAVDGMGNAYIAGQTTAPNFPTSNAVQPTFGGARDGFVAKISTGQ